MVQLPPEKLGSFYLGAKFDQSTKEISTESINYDSRDLTTHAVCVGMTGSGKTGLCIGLLEEAAIDKVPAIIIDPKGDMTNLCLQFDGLKIKDFQKWINPDDAGRKGMSPADYAKATAKKWKDGLASWGQSAERISMLKNAVDYTIFTPGSDSGVPINIMGSFAFPGIDFESDSEMLRERIQGMVAALMGMIQSKEDPVRSREGILLANLFEHYWKKGEDLDLTKMIQGIQNPPFSQLGVFDIETFFPQKDRFDLAMEFNTLVASPQFQYWLQGEALEIDKIYFTPEGKPRHSIFYIAHLSESERMFFVTLLLNSLITWMRSQSGTTSLRSMLYFDEIFGYFPPTAEPPSKKPLLTILKQARAYGVGAVLVTQNPVDIDYKGLSNAGTWFIGKLQTERDKKRVLDGLSGAIAEAGNDIKVDYSKIISSLSSRVFLMHNVHDGAPVVYHTRWAMSYLRGPLTRPQVKELMADKRAKRKTESSIFEDQDIDLTKPEKAFPPSIDPKIQQRFFGVWKSASEAGTEIDLSSGYELKYIPMTLTSAKVRFYNQKRSVDIVKNISMLSEAPDDFGRTEWTQSRKIKNWEKALNSEPDHPDNIPVSFDSIPGSLNTAKELDKVKKDFSDWLYQSQVHTIQEHDKLELFQNGGESLEAFKLRVQLAARELRDDEMDKLNESFDKKYDRIADKIRKEEQDIEEAEQEVRDRRNAEMIGMAETIFSVFVKRRSRSFSSTATKSRMKRKAKQKLEEVEEDMEALQLDYRELEDMHQEKMEALTEKWDEITSNISEIEIKPRRTDVKVEQVILVWHPFWVSKTGDKVSALR